MNYELGKFLNMADENTTLGDAFEAGQNSYRDKMCATMLFLAKLRDIENYPKGGYSSEIQNEWDLILDNWFGENIRPGFSKNTD